MNVRCTKSKGVLPDFFGKLDSTLGPCFYFIFGEAGRSLGKNSCGSSKTADAQPGMRIGDLFEKRRIAEFQLAGHPESDKADVAPERC
jgi:hypothetical protein